MATNDGGAAFPVTACPCVHPGNPGMSLRDWFAGQALIGILGSRNGFLIDVGCDDAPEWAYQIADAMLAEREKEPDDA